jgi:hypothetical protein
LCGGCAGGLIRRLSNDSQIIPAVACGHNACLVAADLPPPLLWLLLLLQLGRSRLRQRMWLSLQVRLRRQPLWKPCRLLELAKGGVGGVLPRGQLPVVLLQTNKVEAQVVE